MPDERGFYSDEEMLERLGITEEELDAMPDVELDDSDDDDDTDLYEMAVERLAKYYPENEEYQEALAAIRKKHFDKKDIAYPACFFKEASGYSVIFPDLNHLATSGTSPDEASSMAAECLAGYLHLLDKIGEPVPVPSNISDINSDMLAQELGFDYSDCFVKTVTADIANDSSNNCSAKIPFDEMLMIAVNASVNRELAEIPPEVFEPHTSSDKEKELMQQLFDADNAEQARQLLKELIHEGSKK